MEYNKLSKKAKGCMYVATAVGALVLSAILLGGYAIAKSNIESELINIVRPILIALEVLILLNLIISPQIRYRRYKYLINSEKIDVIEGLLFITREIVPIERIHKISVQKGPIDRIFGLGKVVVTTAGGEAVIRFLEEEKADEIAEHLKTKINEIVREERNEENNVW